MMTTFDKISCYCKTCFCLVLAMCILLTLIPAILVAESKGETSVELVEGLIQQAPKIIEYLEKKKYTYVGVLKFTTRRGNGKPQFNDGPLGSRLVEQLEKALILKLEQSTSIRLLSDCGSAVAESGRSLNHLDTDIRMSFFSNRMKCRPRWGDEVGKVKADAFLTGEIAYDLNSTPPTAKVTLLCFDKTSSEMHPICHYFPTIDTNLLTDLGRSHVMSVVSMKSPKAPLSLRTIRTPPLVKRATDILRDSPVDFEIRYNGKPQFIRDVKSDDSSKDTDAFINEPVRETKVTFRLVNKELDKTKMARYGVVLLLNGKNSIFPDYPVSHDMRENIKWVLESGKSVTVDGFQKDEKTKNDFTVVPASQVKRELLYGKHAGMVTFVVFSELDEKESLPPPPTDERLVISRGVLDVLTPPTTLRALQGNLLGQLSKEDGKSKRRLLDRGVGGLILPGRETESPVSTVNFKASLEPVASVTIRYYKPIVLESRDATDR